MDKIKELEQKINRTGQFHIDSINEKFAELNKKIDSNLYLIQDVTRKIFVNIDSIHEDIDSSNDEYNEGINDMSHRITKLEENINGRIGEHYDILESKYYKLRSELDSIYKVLEMDALDIQDLYNKLENHPKKKNALEQDFEELVKEGDKNAK